MKVETLVLQRSNQTCELCNDAENVQPYAVMPQDYATAENTAGLCDSCRQQLDKKVPLNAAHWMPLKDTMWSEVPCVQVLAWRMLHRLKNESWAADLLDMLYLDDDNLQWAKAMGDHENDAELQFHVDSNGHQLQDGDSVVLIKSLDVKGSTLNAKMGTVVKNIRLVNNNTEQIEGKIEGQVIVILTKYTRKQ
jgi:protein PhnA